MCFSCGITNSEHDLQRDMCYVFPNVSGSPSTFSESDVLCVSVSECIRLFKHPQWEEWAVYVFPHVSIFPSTLSERDVLWVSLNASIFPRTLSERNALRIGFIHTLSESDVQYVDFHDTLIGTNALCVFQSTYLSTKFECMGLDFQ